MGWGGSLQSWRRRRAGLSSCWVFTPEHTGSFQNIFISPPGTLALVHHCCVEMCFGLRWPSDPLFSQPHERSSIPGPLPAAESLTAGGEGRLVGVPLERARASRGPMPGLAPRFFPPGPPLSPGPTAASVASQVLPRLRPPGPLLLPTLGRQAAGSPLRWFPFSLQLDVGAGETVRNSVNLAASRAAGGAGWGAVRVTGGGWALPPKHKASWPSTEVPGRPLAFHSRAEGSFRGIPVSLPMQGPSGSGQCPGGGGTGLAEEGLTSCERGTWSHLSICSFGMQDEFSGTNFGSHAELHTGATGQWIGPRGSHREGVALLELCQGSQSGSGSFLRAAVARFLGWAGTE